MTTPASEPEPTLTLKEIGREEAACYWVNQKDQAEITKKYLKDKVDDVWHHNLEKQSVGDVVFHNYRRQGDWKLIVVSSVETTTETFTSEGQEYYLVTVGPHHFEDSFPVDDELRSELGRTRYRTDKYYPFDKNDNLNEAYLAELSRDAATYLLSRSTVTGSTGEEHDYWLNTDIDDWKQPGGEMFALATTKRGRKRNNHDVFKQASSGDEALIGL